MLCEFENTTDFHYCFSSTPFLKVPGLKLEVPARFLFFSLCFLSILWDNLLFSSLSKQQNSIWQSVNSDFPYVRLVRNPVHLHLL